MYINHILKKNLNITFTNIDPPSFPYNWNNSNLISTQSRTLYYEDLQQFLSSPHFYLVNTSGGDGPHFAVSRFISKSDVPRESYVVLIESGQHFEQWYHPSHFAICQLHLAEIRHHFEPLSNCVELNRIWIWNMHLIYVACLLGWFVSISMQKELSFD